MTLHFFIRPTLTLSAICVAIIVLRFGSPLDRRCKGMGQGARPRSITYNREKGGLGWLSSQILQFQECSWLEARVPPSQNDKKSGSGRRNKPKKPSASCNVKPRSRTRMLRKNPKI